VILYRGHTFALCIHGTMNVVVIGPHDGDSSIVGRNEWIQARSDVFGVELQGLGMSGSKLGPMFSVLNCKALE
jgi:hypothetical protein